MPTQLTIHEFTNFLLKVSKSQKNLFLKFPCPRNERNIRQTSHIWPPPVAIFLALRVWEGLELVSICNSLNNLEEMTIFGSNDTNSEGMTIIQKE